MTKFKHNVQFNSTGPVHTRTLLTSLFLQFTDWVGACAKKTGQILIGHRHTAGVQHDCLRCRRRSPGESPSTFILDLSFAGKFWFSDLPSELKLSFPMKSCRTIRYTYRVSRRPMMLSSSTTSSIVRWMWSTSEVCFVYCELGIPRFLFEIS